jgi:putative spermidine/putrescine transport system ATP-binding protein/putrescine transport system ATP-binding protein
MQVLELRNIWKRFGETYALKDVSLSISEGSITSLLGPSGCGKTTTLRVIAGFETPDRGELLLAGQNMVGKRPYERNVGLLFQDYALFPHMTVAQNVAYGLRYRGMARPDAERRTHDMLKLVKLDGYGPRRPSQLSGGEQQRVALARAFAIDPKLVLLDEPLSALDAKLRQELRTELKEILSNVGATTIIVTHDQEEAFGIAERVILMNRGQIVQDGSPTEIYLRPSNRFVAEFIGRSNLVRGSILRNGVDRAWFATAGGPNLTILPQAENRETAWACIRPERIAAIDAAVAPDQYENVLRGTVIDCAPLAADVHLLVSLETGQRISVVEKNLGQIMRPVGAPVMLGFNAKDCVIVTD